MKYLLDTNVYFAILHDRGYLARYRDELLRIAPQTYLSSVVRFELLQGARGDMARAHIRRAVLTLERTGRVLAPTDADWDASGVAQGRIWDAQPELRTKHLQNDLLLACSARRIGAIVVTENLRDFQLIGRYVMHRAGDLASLTAERPS